MKRKLLILLPFLFFIAIVLVYTGTEELYSQVIIGHKSEAKRFSIPEHRDCWTHVVGTQATLKFRKIMLEEYRIRIDQPGKYVFQVYDNTTGAERVEGVTALFVLPSANMELAFRFSSNVYMESVVTLVDAAEVKRSGQNFFRLEIAEKDVKLAR